MFVPDDALGFVRHVVFTFWAISLERGRRSRVPVTLEQGLRPYRVITDEGAHMGVIAAFFLLFLCLYLTFLPAIIAYRREHPNRLVILILNLSLGWTGFAWLVAFIWALSHQKGGNDKTVVINNHIIVQGHQSTMEVPAVSYAPEPAMQIMPPRAYVPVPANAQAFGRRA